VPALDGTEQRKDPTFSRKVAEHHMQEVDSP